jgi:hypothetical protein
MDIIPHIHQFVQVDIGKKEENLEPISQLNQITPFGLSEIQYEAHRLYDAGLNVFPQPIGTKGGYPWMRLQFSRLSQSDKLFGLSALCAGQCNLAVMCGSTSGNLFVIDCESPAAFAYQIEEIRKRQIPLWAAVTARGGHIYLRASNGEVENISGNILGELEIRGRGGYVLAPPSVHPSGAKYQWIAQDGNEPPSIHSKDVNWLLTANGQPIQLEVTANPIRNRGKWSSPLVSPASNLSNATRDYLSNGHQIAEGSRNKRLFSAACDLAGNHYSHNEAESILLPVATMSGLPYKEARASVASAYGRVREAARPEQKKNFSENRNWHYALLWAGEQNWQGRTGTSNRAVFLALVERARVGSNENGLFRASIRELSELARVGTTTVQKALLRLKNAKILLSKGSDQTSQASLWGFAESLILEAKQQELKTDSVMLSPHWLRYSESLFNSELTERGALGHSVGFIYQFLRTLDSPMMPRDIAKSLGLTLNQVNYAIHKLKGFELIVRYSQGWYPLDMTLPELEAMFEQVAGKGNARAATYRRQREIFAGRILYNARLRREGEKYFQSLLVTEAFYASIDHDPLLQLGLELGAVLRL